MRHHNLHSLPLTPFRASLLLFRICSSAALEPPAAITASDQTSTSTSTSSQQTTATITRAQMVPPPILPFRTETGLRAYCEKWASEHGYDLVKKGKCGTAHNRWRYELVRTGKTQNNRKITPEQTQRITRSRKYGCKFKMWIMFDEDEQTWSIRYYRDMQPHKHDATPGGTAVTNDRRKMRDEAIRSLILHERYAGVKTTRDAHSHTAGISSRLSNEERYCECNLSSPRSYSYPCCRPAYRCNQHPARPCPPTIKRQKEV